MESLLHKAALTNSAVDDPAFTVPETLAIVVFDMLAGTSDIELAGIVLRGKLIKIIEEHHLHEFLPDRYDSSEMAIDAVARISRTQQSIIKGLTEVIFPYVEDVLGMSVPEFWSKVGRSNAAEIVPHMKAIILDKQSKSKDVNEAVQKLLDRNGTPEEVKREAISDLIDMAQLTTVELRKHLDPDPTPNIDLYVIRRNGRIFILAEVDEDQLDMFMKSAGKKCDVLYTDEPEKTPTVRALVEA